VAVYFNKYVKRVAKMSNPSKSVETVQFLLSLLQNSGIIHDLKPEIRLALEVFVNL